MNLLPVGRTPMDEKSGRSMKSYVKDLGKMLDRLTPWRSGARRLANLRGKVKPGEVVVMLDDGDTPNSPVFKDAKISKGR